MVIRKVSGHADPAEHQSTLAKVSVVIKLKHISQCDYRGIFCLKDRAGALQGELAANVFPGRNFSSVSRLRPRAAFCIY